MASTSDRFYSCLLMYSFIGFNLATVIFSASDVPPSSDHRRRPMILPLYLSPPNSTRHFLVLDGDRRLRHLQTLGRPNAHTAHMKLYDDLLTNGYYTTRLWIGTPPQQFALIVDTGSTVTYVPCSDCERCGKHQDPRFQPELSTTYKPVKCNINCNCDDKGIGCIYERRYAEMSTSSGVLADDNISFGNESDLVPQRAIFGCENVETGDIYRQRADGIMGLGRGPLSVMDQLVNKGVISNSFSLCYGGMNVGGGAMVLGSIPPPPGMVFTHSDPSRSPYYNIELREIHVAGKPLNVHPSVFNGKYGTILDSGTTYAYFPEPAFYAFKHSIMKKISFLKQIPGPDQNFDDICFAGAGRDVNQLRAVFPEVEMVFNNGQKYSLFPENYLFQHTKVSGAYCLGIFKNANDHTTLLGGIIVRNTLVTYDRENTKVGFWKTNCSELWKTLNHQTVVPNPLPKIDQNTTESHPLSPSELPNPLFSGEFQVGTILFNMVLRDNNFIMKPNLTELTEFIAQSLDVNISQVRLLNFTFKENQSVIRWGIFPAKPADYISNATAKSIIIRLQEHRMQLPKKFGSYQLVELDIKPQVEKRWWEQHLWGVTVAVVVSLVLGLLSSGTWLIWRYIQRRRFVSYEPVGGIVREQELQQFRQSIFTPPCL